MTNQGSAIRAYVSGVVAACSAEHILSVEELAPGENNAVYKVAYREQEGGVAEVLVRLGGRDAAARARAEREARVLERVGGSAGPRLYDFSAEAPGFDRPVMCLEFLRGDQPDLTEVVPVGLERLGRVVQQLHAQPIDDFCDWASSKMGLSDYVQERWRTHLEARVGAIRHPLPSQLQERLKAAVAVAADAVQELTDITSNDRDRLALLHADISSANLLWVPEPVLIDWEYARLGDPADEVAYLFTQNALFEPQQDAFWRGYSEALTDADARSIARRIHSWKPITLLGSVLWWLEAWSRTEASGATRNNDSVLAREPGYYLEQAVARLDRF